MSDRLHVKLRRRSLHIPDAFTAFCALRDEFGPDAAFLLESLGGPVRDRRHNLIGLEPLAWVEVRDQQMSVSGRREIADAMRRRLGAAPGVVQGPDTTHVVDRATEVWGALRAVHSTFDAPTASDDRMEFGFLAVLGYDAVRYIEELPRLLRTSDSSGPDILLCLYSAIIDIDPGNGTATLWSSSSALWDAVDEDVVVETLLRVADKPGHPASSAVFGTGPTKQRGTATLSTEAGAYTSWVETAKKHVELGDVYQVQLGHDVELSTDADDIELYRTMRSLNPAPFMGFVPLPDGSMLLSASPELHVLLERGCATMRPIAGTVPRTGDDAVDALAVAALIVDEKERAEHVMLVDLCRNDLGRVAAPGSVHVPELMRVEHYSHVFHLASTVAATLEPSADVYEVLRATFPAGTVTGAPKIRAMEIIERLETSRRGLYAGVFGVVGLAGYANLALTIRTVVRQGGRLSARASAGVVDGSTPWGEWRETLAKLNAAVLAVSGETLT